MKLTSGLLAVALLGCGSTKDAAPDRAPPAAAVAPKTAEPAAPLPQLADNAPHDQLTTGKRTPDEEKRIVELSAQSMAAFPAAKARFSKGLPAGEHMFVTTMLTSPGKTESVFVSVTALAGGKVKGTIASDIVNVTGYKAGDAYEVPESAITDWMIAKPDGSEEGNLVGKYLDTLH